MSSRKRRVYELLDEACAHSPESRDAFLADACGEDRDLYREVAAMLAEPDEDGFLEPVFDVHDALDTGRRLGPYRLVRELGSGGMGKVYLAEREDDFEQQVAVKILHRGLFQDETRRRFRNERQILARLVHPGIARLLDGGTTGGGRPYLVMEHVEGEPITRYCATRHLDVRSRVALVVEICAAVEHAHQHLVVHRDLKPDNILVDTDGRPRLLDFGVAKILESDPALDATVTGEGLAPMTPLYASPEQMGGAAVTTASDVYSLGVLLFELLTGRPPHRLGKAGLDEIVHAVCEDEPPRPSSVATGRALRHQLAGDLDAIVLKALRKEPAERYRSVGHLAEDLRRHLDGLPVTAHRGSWRYRAGKLVRRYRRGLSVAAAFLLLYTSTTLVFWQRAEEQRQRAEEQRQRAEEQRQRAEERFRLLRDLVDDLVRAYDTRGRYTDGMQMLEGMIEQVPDAPEVTKWLANLATMHYRSGRYEEAAALYRGALGLRLENGESGQKLFRVKNNLAMALVKIGEIEEAGQLYREVLEERKALYDPDDKDLASSFRHVAWFEYKRGNFAAAEPLAREALRIRRLALGEHKDVAAVLDLLGVVLLRCGHRGEAKELLREALFMQRRVLGEDHPQTALTEIHLAELLLADQSAEAEKLLRHAVPIQEESHPGSEEALLARWWLTGAP